VFPRRKGPTNTTSVGQSGHPDFNLLSRHDRRTLILGLDDWRAQVERELYFTLEPRHVVNYRERWDTLLRSLTSAHSNNAP
jgi:hypothetical protein